MQTPLALSISLLCRLNVQNIRRVYKQTLSILSSFFICCALLFLFGVLVVGCSDEEVFIQCVVVVSVVMVPICHMNIKQEMRDKKSYIQIINLRDID